MDYEHIQTGPLAAIVSVFFVATFAFTAAAGEGTGALIALGATSLAIAGVVWGFSRLRVTVDATGVTVRFGLGWPSRNFPLDEIAGFRRVRNKWWYGLGVRMAPGGAVIFNIWGLDAVELELKAGTKFRIGTDDIEGLIAALGMRTSLHPGL